MTEIILNSQISAESEYSFLLKNEDERDHFDRPSSILSYLGIHDTWNICPRRGHPSINRSVC